MERHNPFFPMAYDVFGGIGWDDLRAAAYWSTLRGYGAGDGIEALFVSVRVLFARDFDHGFEGRSGPCRARRGRGRVAPRRGRAGCRAGPSRSSP